MRCTPTLDQRRLSYIATVITLLCPITKGAAELAEVQLAREHGAQASKLLQCCHRFVHGWLAHADPESGLIPQNLQSPQWTPENSAADNYPFMVLSAYFTDEELLYGRLADILRAEIRLTTRVGALPDAFSFDTQNFVRTPLDHDRLIFGASEYCKDGLLPLLELMGRTEWFNRLRAIALDICKYSKTPTQFGPIPSTSAEVNGEMMQVLSRLYPATGDTRFLEMALRLADVYFLEVLPTNGYLPCHTWDFTEHHAVNSVLRLNDHGSEIIGGLSEVFVLAQRYAPAKAEQYAPLMTSMIDILLTKCLNPDGLWFQNVDTATGTGSGGVPDTWGYLFNAIYTYYLMTGEERCRNAVEQAMHAICKHTEWGGADAYADSIESAIILLNRIDIPETWQWVDAMTAKMSAFQQEDGVIEGWHGDGNVARTWLMVALAKTSGCYIRPWRPDVCVGTVRKEASAFISVRADKAWTGRLYFDYPRHREHLGLEPDYPRLNQYPEWFTVEDGFRYRVQRIGTDGSVAGEPVDYDGGELRRGLPVELSAGSEWLAEVTLISAPPHGVPPLSLTGPQWVSARDGVEVVLTVENLAPTATEVLLTTTWGQVEPQQLRLGPGDTGEVKLKGTTTEDVEALISARPGSGRATVYHRLLLVTDPNLTDYIDVFGGGEYQGETYLWLNDGDLTVSLKVAPGKAHVLALYWGSKNDDRSGRLTIQGETQLLSQGGYNGFRWLEVEIPGEKVPVSPLSVIFTKPENGKAAFIARVKVRTR
ncbi:MAG: hypothetical protein ACUVX8_18635 [Candidatus Zipacnadales bacterium]